VFAAYRVKVVETDLEQVLRLARNFTEAELGDRKRVEDELSEVLVLWFEMWAQTESRVTANDLSARPWC
jgi:hypothetical protein